MATSTDPATPHGDVIAKLRHDIYLPGGSVCPTCTQHAQVYRRKINSGMAISLIKMYQASRRGEFVHVPTVIGARSREEGKLAYWGLVEEELARREDGGRAGWWRVTDMGRLFVEGRMQLPKYALIYNGRCLSFDAAERAGIKEALGVKFNYDDLMGGR